MIFVVIIILLFFIYFLSRRSGNKMPRFINNSYKSMTRNNICGKKSLYCKNNLIRPYMFRNLSKNYVSNDYTQWDIESVDESNDIYKMKLSDRYCAYYNSNDICLYEFETNSKNEPDCKKKTLCGIDSILDDNVIHYTENNSLFNIKEVGNNFYTIQTTSGKYICNIDNRMRLSDTPSDDCLWQFK